MERCSPVEMRKNLLAVDQFRQAGIDFVAVPVRSGEHKAELVTLGMSVLEGKADEEKELLTQIAYCAEGMFDCEVNNNAGDAKEWKRHLRDATDKYYDHLFKKTGEQHLDADMSLAQF